jgi:small subunit ribosomal protein S18
VSQWSFARPRARVRLFTKLSEDFPPVAKQRTRKPARRRDKKAGAGTGRRKSCPYCKEKVDQVDYKDVGMLRRFISERGKIRSRRISGACRRHQNQIATAVKRARELALLPYVSDAREAGPERGGRSPRDRDER